MATRATLKRVHFCMPRKVCHGAAVHALELACKRLAARSERDSFEASKFQSQHYVDSMMHCVPAVLQDD